MALDWIDLVFLERIKAVRGELAKIDNQFITDLTQSEAGEDVIIDKGDVLLLKAMSHGIDIACNLVFTYNLNVSLETLVEFRKEGTLSAEKTLDTFDSLLAFASSDRRSVFESEMRQMEVEYKEASDFIVAQGSSASGVLSKELGSNRDLDSEVRDSLSTLMDSLNGEEVSLAGKRVNLSRLVATEMSFRDFLPEFVGDDVAPGSFPDPTLDGLLPGQSPREVENMIFKLGSLGGMIQYAEDLESLMDLEYWETFEVPSPFGDEDGDGQDNFSEWIRGTNPFTRDVIWEDLSRSVIAPGQVEFKISFIRRKSLANWALEVWVSDDLVNWDKTGTQIEIVGAPSDNGDGFSETVTYQLSNAAALSKSKFIQIKAVFQK